MTGNDKVLKKKCVNCGKKVLVVRGKSGDDGHPLDTITAIFECNNCGLHAMQYYRLKLSPDRRSLLLPHGVTLPCDFIDRDADPSRTWIGRFPATNEWRLYIVAEGYPETEPTPDDLKEFGRD